MKLQNLTLTMAIGLLAATSCGKRDIKSGGGEKSSNNLECAVANTVNYGAQAFAADYDIKFHRTTVDQVRSDLRELGGVSVKDFWAKISPDTRALVNFELNLFLNKKSAPENTVYRATAYFFTQYYKTFTEGVDYRIRNEDGKVYSFSLRNLGSSKLELYGYKCGVQKRIKLDGAELVPDLMKSSEVQEIFECRTDRHNIYVMEGKNQNFLGLNKDVHVMNKQDLKKENLRLSYAVEVVGPQIDLLIMLKKTRSENVGNWSGRKSFIEIKSPELNFSGFGACNTLMHALEI